MHLLIALRGPERNKDLMRASTGKMKESHEGMHNRLPLHIGQDENFWHLLTEKSHFQSKWHFLTIQAHIQGIRNWKKFIRLSVKEKI